MGILLPLKLTPRRHVTEVKFMRLENNHFNPSTEKQAVVGETPITCLHKEGVQQTPYERCMAKSCDAV